MGDAGRTRAELSPRRKTREGTPSDGPAAIEPSQSAPAGARRTLWISERLALLAVLSVVALLVAAHAYNDPLSALDLAGFSAASVDDQGRPRGGALGKGAGSCRMSWMSPSYIKIDSFGSEYTRLSGKYTTYLYREQGWNLEDKVGP